MILSVMGSTGGAGTPGLVFCRQLYVSFRGLRPSGAEQRGMCVGLMRSCVRQQFRQLAGE